MGMGDAMNIASQGRAAPGGEGSGRISAGGMRCKTKLVDLKGIVGHVRQGTLAQNSLIKSPAVFQRPTSPP